MTGKDSSTTAPQLPNPAAKPSNYPLRSRAGRQWIWAAVAASALMAAVEFLRQLLDPHLAISDSHAITIAVAGVAAGAAVWVVLRRQEVFAGQAGRVEGDIASLAAAVAQAGEAVVITDTQGNIQYVNPAFTRITGYSAAEATGQNPRFLKSGRQDPAFYTQLWQTILQ